MTNLTRRTFGKILVATTGAAMLTGKATAASHTSKHTVTITNFEFAPASLTINAGDTVEFINNDSAPHTATGSAFDTGRLGKGASKSVQFTTAGTFDYLCNFHRSMKGSITVEG